MTVMFQTIYSGGRMKDIVSALVIGLSAGVLGGIFGIGGGILIVPALMLLLGFTQFRAQGTSLVALLAPVGLLALLEYHRKGDTDWRVGSLVAAGFLIGGFFGSKLALSMDELVVRRGFAGFLIVVGIWLLVRRQ
jgi:uncharacterized membrane protein YfcA